MKILPHVNESTTVLLLFFILISRSGGDFSNFLKLGFNLLQLFSAFIFWNLTPYTLAVNSASAGQGGLQGKKKGRAHKVGNMRAKFFFQYSIDSTYKVHKLFNFLFKSWVSNSGNLSLYSTIFDLILNPSKKRRRREADTSPFHSFESILTKAIEKYDKMSKCQEQRPFWGSTRTLRSTLLGDCLVWHYILLTLILIHSFWNRSRKGEVEWLIHLCSTPSRASSPKLSGSTTRLASAESSVNSEEVQSLFVFLYCVTHMVWDYILLEIILIYICLKSCTSEWEKKCTNLVYKLLCYLSMISAQLCQLYCNCKSIARRI